MFNWGTKEHVGHRNKQKEVLHTWTTVEKKNVEEVMDGKVDKCGYAERGVAVDIAKGHPSLTDVILEAFVIRLIEIIDCTQFDNFTLNAESIR